MPISVSTAVLHDTAGTVLGGVETFRDLSEVEELRRRLQGSYVSVAHDHRARGRAAKQIVDEAQRWRADLIIVGAHDRGRVGRLLKGSVFRRVSRHALCPVDVVGPTH